MSVLPTILVSTIPNIWKESIDKHIIDYSDRYTFYHCDTEIFDSEQSICIIIFFCDELSEMAQKQCKYALLHHLPILFVIDNNNDKSLLYDNIHEIPLSKLQTLCPWDTTVPTFPAIRGIYMDELRTFTSGSTPFYEYFAKTKSRLPSNIIQFNTTRDVVICHKKHKRIDWLVRILCARGYAVHQTSDPADFQRKMLECSQYIGILCLQNGRFYSTLFNIMNIKVNIAPLLICESSGQDFGFLDRILNVIYPHDSKILIDFELYEIIRPQNLHYITVIFIIIDEINLGYYP